MAAEDTAGNILGVRALFTYTSDSGEEFNYLGDRSVGLAVGNPLATTTLNDEIGTSQKRPIEMRYFLLRKNAAPFQTKKVVCADPEDAAWTSNASTTFTINGQGYLVTARVGEKRYVRRLTP